MIVVDASAIVAILLGEPEADDLRDSILSADAAVMAAPGALEVQLVAMRKGGERLLQSANDLLAVLGVAILPWTQDHLALATEALRRFGGRPARLNYGDCMAYALARSLDAPLLFKGDDFRQTDLRAAL